MATPLAIAAANGKAARKGIYIKDGSTVETLARVTTVVFDKTGTLTEGNLSLVTFDGSDEMLLLAAGLEQHSQHPIARAFAEGIADRFGLDVEIPTAEAVESLPGFGLRGTVKGHRVVVGRPDWVAGQVPGSTREDFSVDEVAQSAQTPVAIAVDGQLVALAGCGDRIRPQSKSEVRKLRDRGIRVMLLSGDHPEVVRSVAAAVGISSADAHGAVGPEEKQRVIDELRRAETVMMIGDGANDAAALRSADVGVAVGNENSPCLVASDIFVPSASGATVEPLLIFGKRVLGLIRRNLALSLAYNLVAGAAAIGGFVTPLVAAIAMPLSSLFVVSTSVAVRPFKPDGGTKRSAVRSPLQADERRIDAHTKQVVSQTRS
jgi:Cu2+-exporting ATPase